MFHFAFCNLSKSDNFSPIPVDVVITTQNNTDDFKKVIDTLSTSGSDQLLESSYTTEKDALSHLEDKTVSGILYFDGNKVSLTVSSNMSYDALNQSILNSFVEHFNMTYSAITTIAKEHPDKLLSALSVTSKDVSYNSQTSLSDSNMDQQVSYFFNLIAMVAMYACMSGCGIAIDHKANLSDIGARNNISPVHKMISLLGSLAATCLVQFACVLVSLAYITFGLGVSFGNEAGYSILATFIGCLAGSSFGFFIGSIGKMSEQVKMGIMMGATMTCCLFSGLFAGNMRIYVDKVFPLFNHINPTALISDSFYSLTIYQSHDRFFENIIILLVISAAFCFGGFMMERKETYASL
jgi:ABC-2 type transport system permease protein